MPIGAGQHLYGALESLIRLGVPLVCSIICVDRRQRDIYEVQSGALLARMVQELLDGRWLLSPAIGGGPAIFIKPDGSNTLVQLQAALDLEYWPLPGMQRAAFGKIQIDLTPAVP